MFQHDRLNNELTFWQKVKELDYVLLISIFLLSILSLFVMYSTDGGEILFHTKSHFSKIVIFFLLTAVLSLTGLDFITSISGAATSISNVGPGLGETIGPNGNFSSLTKSSKWALSFGMILGRLELFAILVLFVPSFWRKF